ncbi:MAG: peptidoglycan-binding protein [Acidobacteriota bacterium]|nr:peptidoglycan-binding protein [Acidobacteriota bacterium]
MQVSGAPERIWYTVDRPCFDLECRDSNTLYYLTGKQPDSPFVEIRRLDLWPSPPNDESAYSESANTEFNKRVEGFALTPEMAVAPEPPDIKWLQRSLNVIYADSPPLSTDGVLGAKTRQMLKVFQQEYGLIADGILGPTTRAKIVEVLSQRRAQRVGGAG